MTAQTAYSGKILDFSTNLNPLGMPPEVMTAAAEAARASDSYPDPLCRKLRQAIGAHDGAEPAHILCGGGAADLIYRLAQALRPRLALVTAPTFSEYEAALAQTGCTVRRYPLEASRCFDLGPDFLEEIQDGTDLVFLCTPNNPTGRLISPALLEEIAAHCRTVGAVLAVDECFLSLSDGAGPGMAPVLGEYPNLFLLRAFTKSYAMAGLRLGYGLCGDTELLDRMAWCGPPWNVSSPAQAAGLAALKRPDWPQLARRLIAEERPRLADGLAALRLEITPGQANYLLFRAAGRTDLRERLLERGILIRACGNYPGLGSDYYRVCVGRAADNGRLLAALAEVL